MENKWMGKEDNYILNLTTKSNTTVNLESDFFCTSLFQLWKQSTHSFSK